ncbi:transcriptional regulator, TetR family [Microbacterium sp. cf046]|uniref:TetR/AcrR family transcriptional regulator n=1 Tax=Microbacterium sp. cf046 TaxID=1761803 RepID=UPI0008E4A23E|nr:TetR/AcrR family transcriptional regulator [Microbacterium sp. cf046]SFR99693.1 transcriptional regulator, TetR family [Microbacterium sp. cf046]
MTGVTDTETAMLDAALDEVLAHGIRRTTAADIARRAGVSRQTLYRYWPDVQALLAALVTRELFAVVPRGDAATSLEGFADALVDTADRIRALPLVDRLRETDPELFARYILERLGTSQRGIHREIAARVARGQHAGFIRPGDPDRLAAMLLLIAQSAIQSAPLVREWLPPVAWKHELHAAVVGYLAVRDAAR